MFGKGFTLFKLLGFEVQMDISRLIIQSVSCWTCDLHIDGFRSELATIFTRDKDGRINLDDPPIISEISGLDEFASIRLVTRHGTRPFFMSHVRQYLCS